MATVNPWKKFENLLPQSARAVVTITAQNGDGTSTATLRGGESVRVGGESITVGNKAFVKDGVIVGQASSLPYSQLTV